MSAGDHFKGDDRQRTQIPRLVRHLPAALLVVVVNWFEELKTKLPEP